MEEIFYNAFLSCEFENRNNLRKIFKIYKSWKMAWYSLQKRISDKVLPLLSEGFLKYHKTLDPIFEFEQIKNQKIDLILEGSEFYPQKLFHIPDYPLGIYIKGNKSILNNFSIAVVGTRKYSLYGKMQAELVSDFLSNSNITIVSGFAKGIDSFSHISAVKNKKPTIAVLGCGLNQIYPYCNKKLAEEILKYNGCFISEYHPNCKPIKYHFPERNRIIAGISDATVIVEAPEKSGAIITANLALDYDRPVFTIPGDVDRDVSKGCIRLIQNSCAYPIISPHEILREMNIQPEIPFETGSGEAITLLSQNEERIFKSLSHKKIKTADEISEETKLNLSETLVELSFLEMKGYIQRIGPGFVKK